MDYIRALSSESDRLVVIANEVRSLPRNLDCEILSLGKEHGRGRLERTSRYGSHVFRLVKGLRPDALIAHMCPVYLNLAAPICKAMETPLILWFAHPEISASLRLSQLLSDVVLTSLPSSYPLRSPKVQAIGQGTDVHRFRLASPTPDAGPFRLLALGRTSPSKDLGTAVRSMKLLRANGVEATLRIVGPSTTDLERRHRSELESLIRQLQLDQVVKVADPVAPSRVPSLLADCDALVNCTVEGSGDKVIFEAMAMGRTPLVSNTAFSEVLGGLPIKLQFAKGDESDLAARVKDVHDLDGVRRDQVGQELRKRVIAEHSLERWAQRVVNCISSIHRGSGKGKVGTANQSEIRSQVKSDDEKRA